ncbi:chromosome segregation protein SMC [Corynebacterium liangguodongii]|uniref:Chromosome partition protein Smc n=1 Tax=Corynebacterium liangguodongii TaxID=2079535 RepID=A0A2S0WER0_9CORY|nr:chromosome segregation protein SMC [Corynebacterium liangguodongii]AWB84265.1 chromosome segregation protein SMC [Corynebacterium liangguodongii]PWC00274.1 chromosome segregation protein SMC [Corynebacterium liangguodongii]
MHLKSLTLKGFKSFASATTMKFEPGICAVVGPNGSGKSNVVDALAWVMGEQGAKNLRGGKMEDVIFAGAGERKPLGRAEVTLTFDNSDHRLPIEYTEVAITRRMFRDGASEYEINGSKARLMDIQELLSDSGIGREMHIIVGQGKLAEILESRPEERRAFIEEAAGVLKHRRRKEKAQRKLTGMQANLDRLQDLTDELGKQLKPLARQAEAAKRAASVQATLRSAKLTLAADQILTLRAALGSAASAASRAAERLEESKAALEDAEALQGEVEAAQREAEPAAEEAQQLWFSLSTLAERISATLRIATERASHTAVNTVYQGPDPDDLLARASVADERYAEALEAAEEAAERLEEIREAIAERQAEYDEADREHQAQLRAIADRREGVVRLLALEESQRSAIEAARGEIERIGEAVEEARMRLRAAAAEVEDLQRQRDELAPAREPIAARQARAAAESDAADERLEQLREDQRERERAVFTLEARLATLVEQAPRAAAADVLGEGFEPLASSIGAEAGVATALSAALGPFAEALVGSGDVVGALTGAQRAIVIAREGGDSWRMDTDAPVDWLLDHVRIDAAVAGPVTRLLADVALTDTVDDARAVIRADPRLRAVTRAGVLVGQGWVAAGAGTASPVEVGAAIEKASSELEEARAALGELSGTLEGAKVAAEEARVAAAGAKAALREHDADATAVQRELARAATSRDALAQQVESAAQRAAEAEARLSGKQAELAETKDRLSRVDDAGAEQQPSTAARDRAAQALNQAKSLELEAAMAARATQQEAQAAAGKGDLLRRQAEQERAAKVRFEVGVAKQKAHAELAAAVADNAREVAARVADAQARAAARRDELQAHLTALRARAQQARSHVSAARAELTRLGDSAHSADIAREQAQVRLDEAEAKATETLGIAVADLVSTHAPAADFDRAAEKARLAQAEKDLRALGKVNPLALEEYKALEERYSFLSTQLADVLQARKDLIGVIEDVDGQILQLFTDAWEDVERQFPAVFHTLFPGGEARLILTEPGEMLTTGIEIEARPPGKKVKRLSLLSGGEKSLTALAFLVAIFRARPSPFYVLDEVEAALDDVNLRRLIALLEELREDSQLIVITHQKPTMDVANVLYGVTMRGDGVTRVLSQRMRPAPVGEGTRAP